jgi:hypothetical protein
VRQKKKSYGNSNIISACKKYNLLPKKSSKKNQNP